MIIGYRRESFVRETRISATDGMTFDDQGLVWMVHLEPLDVPGRWGKADAFGRGRSLPPAG